MNATLAPVVVFAYNRPLHLQRTLDALAACRLADRTHVHVFADGNPLPGVVSYRFTPECGKAVAALSVYDSMS